MTHITTQITVPGDKIGLIIGKKGRKLSKLQKETQCKILIDKSNTNNKQVSIRGTYSNIQFAIGLIESSISIRYSVVLIASVEVLVEPNKIISFQIPVSTQLPKALIDHPYREQISLCTIKEAIQKELQNHNINCTLKPEQIQICRVIDGSSIDGITVLDLQIMISLNESQQIITQPRILLKEENAISNCRVLDLVSFVIVTRNNNNVIELLMVDEASNVGWFLPAGHLEFGETFIEGGIRETLEESGVNIKIVGFNEIVYELNKNYSALHCVLVGEYDSGDVKTIADNESLGAAWIPIQQVINEIGSGEQIGNSSRNYRKPYEIGPMIRRFYETPSVIPIYHSPRSIVLGNYRSYNI